MRGRRREQVAPVERAGDRLERVGRVRDLHRDVDPRELDGGEQQAVVGPDEQPPLPVSQRDGRDGCPRPPGRPRPGERPRAGRAACSPARGLPACTACAGIPCVTSITRVPGAIRSITPWHDADEVVLEPEVGEEADDHADRVYGGVPRASTTAATSPAVSCVSASATTSIPAARAARVVSGPMVTAGSVSAEATERAGGRRRRQDDEIAVEAAARSSHRAVERRRVGGERVRQEPCARPRRRRTERGRRDVAAPRAALPGSRPAARDRLRRAHRRSPGRWPRSGAGAPSSAAGAPARRSRSSITIQS